MTTVTAATPAPRSAASLDTAIAGIAIVALVCGLLVLVGVPLWVLLSKSLYAQGQYVGLRNFVEYVTTPSLFKSVGNSIFVAGLTMLIAASM